MFGLILIAKTALAVDAPPEPLRIGSKRFTESYILAQVLAQQAAPHTVQAPRVLQGLGNSAIVYEALRSGAIDVYPEYAGTISLEILKNTQPMNLDEMRRALLPLGLGVGVPLGFNNGYALAMTDARAEQLGVRTLSDLARQPTLKLGLSNEFLGRSDGWGGLAKAYALPHMPTGLDHGLAFDAIKAQQIDVIDIYSTDAKIAHLGLRVLADDRSYFPRYDALLLYRLDLPTRLPAAWAALQKLEGRMDESAMIALNARAELQGVAFDVIARDFLAGQAPASRTTKPDPERRGFWAKLFGPDLVRLTGQHLALVLASVSLAALLALPTILAGVRTATAIAIGTATIAAFIGAGGFGERIVTGLALNDSDLLLAGAVPAAVLALLSEALFEVITRNIGIKR